MSPRLLIPLLSLALFACRSKGEPAADTGGITADPVDEDGDGFSADEDCDDGDAEVNPSATEVCDGIDNDCDGEADEGVTATFYADADEDTYGDPLAPIEACDAPAGTVSSATDCDDTDPDSYPGATERCDGLDNDCDGEIDEDVLATWYTDADGDGWGDPGAPVEDCDPPSGTVDNDGDCDDDAAAVSPNATEVCDGADNDCDADVDEDDAADAPTWYVDGDGDGYGTSAEVVACDQPSGTADNDEDCDDADFAIHPDATEVCDGADNDCDGTIDEPDAADASIWYADSDGDGYGSSVSTVACDQPTGFTANSTDCDDGDAASYPGAAEVCDEEDNDCDGAVDEGVTTTFYADADGDGAGDASSTVEACSEPTGYESTATDCDDSDAGVSPNATELCDGVDNDCDGTTDEGDAADASTWYADSDGDGYGDPASSADACSQPSSYESNDDDCDDSDATLNPDTVWYRDADSDGYGTSSTTTASCLQPAGYQDNPDDCDDSDGGIYPGASDTPYDGVDADCAGDDDYDVDGDGEEPYATGGTDCDDDDATVNQAAGNCRATCTPPSATTLATYDPGGASDLQFDADCVAYVSSLISGTDYVYAIESDGSRTIYTGTSNHNIGSVAVDPNTAGRVAVSYNNVGYLGVSSSASIPVVATGGFRTGTNFSSGYLRQNASSIAWDSAGCIWVPNFSANGALDCFSATGTSTTLATLSAYVESVALDVDEALYASVGDTIYSLDGAGAATAWYTLSDAVLDMAFDITGEVYVLTDANEIVLIDAAGSSDSVFDTVASEGKLAISPDGTLYHLDSQPTAAATYSSWSL